MAILLDLGAYRFLWATNFVCLQLSMRGDGAGRDDRLKGKRDLRQTVRGSITSGQVGCSRSCYSERHRHPSASEGQICWSRYMYWPVDGLHTLHTVRWEINILHGITVTPVELTLGP